MVCPHFIRHKARSMVAVEAFQLLNCIQTDIEDALSKLDTVQRSLGLSGFLSKMSKVAVTPISVSAAHDVGISICICAYALSC